MMWVCRAGKDAVYFDEFIKSSIIALPWDGYDIDLSKMRSRDEFKQIVINEKGSDNRISISNWAGQLYSFCIEMKIGDYVLVPAYHSKYYALVRIVGVYQYENCKMKKIHHYRAVEILCDYIARDSLPPNIQYSLGAYRTVFKCKAEDVVLTIVNQTGDDK